MRQVIKSDKWFAFMSSTKCYNSWEGHFNSFTISEETYREWSVSKMSRVIGPEILGGCGDFSM